MALRKCKECGHKVSTKAKACPSCGAPIKKQTRALAGCLTIIILAAFVVICAELFDLDSGSSPSSSSRSTQTQQSTPVQAERDLLPRTPSVPADVSYSIVHSDIMRSIKRSLDVKINKKVSKDVLRTLAIKLKSQDPRNYERTFICYYLPHMTVGAGAWATTHFDPKLEVCILGLTAEEEKALVAEPTPASRELIGRWLDESPFGGNRTTIFRENGKLYIEQKFGDGSILKKQLVEKQSPFGRRFNKIEGSSAGDHWVIDARGNLQTRDNDGLITTAKQIK